jgi:hypothetical protein
MAGAANNSATQKLTLDEKIAKMIAMKQAGFDDATCMAMVNDEDKKRREEEENLFFTPFPNTLSLTPHQKTQLNQTVVITTASYLESEKVDEATGKTNKYKIFQCNVLPRLSGGYSAIEAKHNAIEGTALYNQIMANIEMKPKQLTQGELAMKAANEKELQSLANIEKIIEDLEEKAAQAQEGSKEEANLLKELESTEKKLKRKTLLEQNLQSMQQHALIPEKFNKFGEANFRKYTVYNLKQPIIINATILYKTMIATPSGVKYATIIRLGNDEIVDKDGNVIVEAQGETKVECKQRVSEWMFTERGINDDCKNEFYEDYDDYDYSEEGCGEGYSCEQCSNYGCSANLIN